MLVINGKWNLYTMFSDSSPHYEQYRYIIEFKTFSVNKKKKKEKKKTGFRDNTVLVNQTVALKDKELYCAAFILTISRVISVHVNTRGLQWLNIARLVNHHLLVQEYAVSIFPLDFQIFLRSNKGR